MKRRAELLASISPIATARHHIALVNEWASKELSDGRGEG